MKQRFYSSQFGRFMSADRFKAASTIDSGSWNKYSYVQNDPVNWLDPRGTTRCSPDEPCDDDGGVGWPGQPTPCTAVASSSCEPGNGGAGEPGGGGGSGGSSRESRAWAMAQEKLSNGNELVRSVFLGNIPAPCQSDFNALGQVHL